MPKTSVTPRIYVACLASYNAGILHGRWIDVADIDDVREEVHQVLKTSPEPNVTKQDFRCDCGHTWHHTIAARNSFGSPKASLECPQCGADASCSGEPYPAAEEFAIHDYEGFGPIQLGEYQGLEDVVALAEAIEKYSERDQEAAFLAYVDHLGGMSEVENAKEHFEEAYRGEFDDEGDYAQQLHEDLGSWVPDWLEFYVNWDAMGRDMRLNGGIFTVDAGGGKIYVFDGNI